jgi:hypothetical protein
MSTLWRRSQSAWLTVSLSTGTVSKFRVCIRPLRPPCLGTAARDPTNFRRWVVCLGGESPPRGPKPSLNKVLACVKMGSASLVARAVRRRPGRDTVCCIPHQKMWSFSVCPITGPTLLGLFWSSCAYAGVCVLVEKACLCDLPSYFLAQFHPPSTQGHRIYPIRRIGYIGGDMQCAWGSFPHQPTDR